MSEMLNYLYSTVCCCFPQSETQEYEKVLDEDGTCVFVYDPETKQAHKVDTIDEQRADDGQLLFVYEGWKGCTCAKCDSKPRPNATRQPKGTRRYHKLHANEGDADFETSMAALNHDGLDSDDEDEEAIKLSKPVKSCLRKPARGKGKAQADSPTPRRTEKLVHFDNEFEIAWTHKKERYERSFYPPSMREAKTRSEGIANEVQDLHKDLFGDDGSYCFAMAVRKARLAKMQKAKMEALNIAEGTSSTVSGGGASS